ncbi:MAG: hypothetical protein ACK6AO_11350 [Planctomycetota bacterium]|jgi:hypothetical protein
MTYLYELELLSKKAELTLVETRIADRQSELATELDAILEFQSRYVSNVSVLYRTLDQIQAEIAVLLVAGIPEPPAYPPAITSDENEPVHLSKCTGLIKFSSSTSKNQAGSASELLKLFRRAAIKLHPDLATDDRDRQQRCRAMAQVNGAYQRGDLESIQLILLQLDKNEGTSALDPILKELNCVIRHLELAKKRLHKLDQELGRIKADEWYVLYQKEKQWKSKGKDLINALSLDAKKEIAKAEKVLNSLRKKDRL